MGALAWWLVPICATILAAVWVTAAARWRRSRSRQAFGSIEDIERFRRALARPNVVTRPKDDRGTRR
jgi:hypothetical protein